MIAIVDYDAGNLHSVPASTVLQLLSTYPGARDASVDFDEAQRVWTAEKVNEGIGKRVRRRHLTLEQAAEVLRHPHSEPELLLSVMERCPGWCVIIALVGGGQENAG